MTNSKKNPPQVSAIRLSPVEHIGEATRKILWFHFNRMLAYEKACINGQDIEAIHDMRVAIRRMRSAFDTFSIGFEKSAIKDHKQGLKETGLALGHVRDFDVLLEKTQIYIKKNLKEKKGLTSLINIWQFERADAHQELANHLQNEAYSKFKDRFELFLITPGAGIKQHKQENPKAITLSQLAPKIIFSQLGQIRAFDSLLSANRPTSLHQLRIEFKKFRYTIEFLESVLQSSSKGVLSLLKKIQDQLGDLNDANVAYLRIEKILNNNQNSFSKKQIEAVKKYQITKLEERDLLSKNFINSWKLFEAPTFRNAILNAMSSL